MKDAPKDGRCACGKRAARDYAAEGKKGAIIDGEHSGYYPEDTGFPVDPTNPAKRICPAKVKAKDAFSRLRDRTQGGMDFA